MGSQPAIEDRVRCSLTLPVSEPILALGADTASRPALAVEDHCQLAMACGDIVEADPYAQFVESVSRLMALVPSPVRVVAHDLHPGYVSTAFARSLTDMTRIPILHHEAHVAAALTYFSIVGDVIGLAFDGTGYGTDGAVWGGEILVGSTSGFRRAAHLHYVPMPGGEAAIRSPWKMAVSHVMDAFGPTFRKADVPHFVYISEGEVRQIATVCAARNLAPLTSSVGRLFDAVAILCGLFPEDGELLPAKLMALADPDVEEYYVPRITESDAGLILATGPMIQGVVEDIRSNVPVNVVAARFHNALAHTTAQACRRIAERTGIRTVVLSGGVFFNQYLVTKLTKVLRANRLEVYCLPPPLVGDEGIGLGQAAIAAERIS